MTKSRKVAPFRVRPQIRNGKPTGKWFVDIPSQVTGTSRKRKLFDNQRSALEVARELNRRVDPVSGHLVAQSKTTGLVFRELVTLWETEEELRVKTLKKRASTFRTDRMCLKSLKAFLGDDDVGSITPRRLMEYQEHRHGKARMPHTITGELRTFSLVLHWAEREGYVSKVPRTEPIPIPTPPRREIILTPQEVVCLLEALPERLRPLVRFIGETGCRVGEALNLQWDAVDEVNGYVAIRSREGWTPKTAQSERDIPLNSALLEVLRHLSKEGIYVFQGKKPDAPIRNFRTALATAIKKAGIHRKGQLLHITPQTLRKCYGTWQAMRGVNESVLQGLLGHAKGSRVTQKYYVHATEEAKRAAVLELPVTGNK